MNKAELKVGDKVNYRGVFGTGPIQQATIEAFDINKGRTCVDLDNRHWAYLDQIVSIVKVEAR